MLIVKVVPFSGAVWKMTVPPWAEGYLANYCQSGDSN